MPKEGAVSVTKKRNRNQRQNLWANDNKNDGWCTQVRGKVHTKTDNPIRYY